VTLFIDHHDAVLAVPEVLRALLDVLAGSEHLVSEAKEGDDKKKKRLLPGVDVAGDAVPGGPRKVAARARGARRGRARDNARARGRSASGRRRRERTTSQL
jgi:hypothetical protein